MQHKTHDLIKGLLAAMLLLFAPAVRAQFAIEGGVNVANLTLKAMGVSASTTFKYGISMGMLAGIPVSDHMYLEPGMFYDVGGCKLSGPPEGIYSINSLDFPINIQYKSGTKCGSRFLIGAGPLRDL